MGKDNRTVDTPELEDILSEMTKGLEKSYDLVNINEKPVKKPSSRQSRNTKKQNKNS